MSEKYLKRIKKEKSKLSKTGLKLDFSEAHKEVYVTGGKNEKLALIKTLKEVQNRIKGKPFETALVLLREFYSLLTVHVHFIKKENLVKEFTEYMVDLTENLVYMFNNFTEFSKIFESHVSIIFGE